MRFTVHDSPDYYQLKVSVFNDDKKTELIGETWVALEQIVVPGGGQNDVWHTLNCKGKYAGEIRIELTYYDTRPREEKPEKRRQSAPVDASLTQTVTGVAGPRQPKPVKRRPLPADPTDSSRSSPLPYTPPSSTLHRYAESPDDYGFESTPHSERPLERPQQDVSRGSTNSSYQQQRLPQSGSTVMAPFPQQPTQSPYEAPGLIGHDDYRQEDEIAEGIPQHAHRSEEPSDYEGDYSDLRQSRPLTQPLQHSQGMIHAHSSPATIDARPRQGDPHLQQYPGSSPPKKYSYDESPVYQPSMRDNYDTQPSSYMPPGDDQEAPPPPVHRNSGSQPASEFHGNARPNAYAPIPATAPLNIRNGRGSMTGSPLSQVQSTPSHVGYPPSTSPSTSQSYFHPTLSVSSHTSYSQLRDQRSQSPIRDYSHSMPPSLVPGYEPSIAEDESERIIHENRMTARHNYSDPPPPHLQHTPMQSDPTQPQHQQPPRPIDLSRSHYQQASATTPQQVPQPRPRNVINVQERRAHRQSAPVAQPQAMSPNPRTPARKSISPHPGSAPTERRPSEVPFSPDSFDAFNPSISATSSVNEPGARYNTPEQAKEASRQHERQEKFGDGPIIGNDGRIIDPSDHLPTDTWAPEPEQKVPKKGPQVTMRFRHSPQGAQPMPAVRRPGVEHSMSSPAYINSPENASPVATSRGRLQKKPRAAMVQPASSPSVPTLNTTPRSSPLRPQEANYPLRERENYAGHGGSPSYGRPSLGNIPPPVPGKVPIGGGQEDWDSSALSEEISRIDIGVGEGSGRTRRSRYGL